MGTCADALRAAVRSLSLAGIPDPEVDARLLLLAAADLDRLALILDPDRPMPAGADARLDRWVARRAAREPVSRILGRRDFWGLTLAVTPDVLDPRPDTETLVAAVLDAVGAGRAGSLRILDLGTGSGAILCALLSELPDAVGVAVDRSAAACAVARRNLAAHGLADRGLVVQGDWASALPSRRFDVVASNPPYIETEVVPTLDPEVRDHDPIASLDGGLDGLACYRLLAGELGRVLSPGGLAALEVGRGQHAAVGALLARAGFDPFAVTPDLAGIGRVVAARWPGAAPG